MDTITTDARTNSRITAAYREHTPGSADLAKEAGELWQPLLGGQGPVGTYVTSLDEDLRRRIAEAVKRAYCSGAPDAERSLTATAWAVRGRVP
jgi:hypothetical protein